MRPSETNAAAAIQDFDLRALPAEFYDDPFPYYHALRAADPVRPMPDGSYLLTRYDDVNAVYRDTDGFSSDKQVEFKPKFGDSPLYAHHTTSLVFNDPPLHTRGAPHHRRRADAARDRRHGAGAGPAGRRAARCRRRETAGRPDRGFRGGGFRSR